MESYLWLSVVYLLNKREDYRMFNKVGELEGILAFIT